MKCRRIDFHSHILPGIDDGSKNVDMSLEMLKMERQQGIDCVIASPHFYAERDAVDDFFKRRISSAERLARAEAEYGKALPELFYGAEVCYFTGIGKASVMPRLCIGETSCLLLEMPFCQWETEMYTNVKELIERQKLQIILAHIERYISFQKDRTVWTEIMSLPLYKQMNAGPFLHWKTRRKSLRLLEEAGLVLLGSDCHNTQSRRPNLGEGRALIESRLGEARLLAIDELGERMLGA